MIATEAAAGFSCGNPSLLLLSACIERKGYDLGIGDGYITGTFWRKSR